MSKWLPIGLVGCGRWGRHILRDLLTLGCDVIVVAPSDDSRRNAAEGGATLVVSTVNELPSVAGAVVASPTITHAAVIESLLERNIPIFTEKPMTSDRASAIRLVQMAPDRLFVMDKWRYHPGVEMLAEIARSGELGPVLGLRTTRVQWGCPHPDVDPIWIFAPHDLSVALEVFGTIPPARSSFAEVVNGHPVSLVGILGEDPWLVIDVSSRYAQYRREIRMHCRDGVAVLEGGYAEYVKIARGADPYDTTLPEAELRPISTSLPLLRELQAFVGYLQGGPLPRSSAAEGALIVSTIADLRELAGLDEKRSMKRRAPV